MRRFSFPSLPLLLVAIGLAGGACQPKSPSASPETGSTAISAGWTSEPLGQPLGNDIPWITHLRMVDVDADGRLDVLAADARANQVQWLKQTADGRFEEQPLGPSIAGPAWIEPVDFDQDGDLDVLVGAMGIITPNNERIGSLVALENRGSEGFAARVIEEGITRLNYVGAADLDGDGDLDLSLGQFGYFEGEIRWLRHVGNWQFESVTLLTLPGAIHVPPVDIDQDGDLDLVALVSQDSEEIYLFENDGVGNFRSRVLWGSTNRDYGSSGIEVADMDGDGDPDIVYTNGDGFDYVTPGARPWHGIQWLENTGAGRFAFHRIADFSGAYTPRTADLDRDGDTDIVAVSAFNDWTQPATPALVVYTNNGRGAFAPQVLALQPTHLIALDIGDLDGDGRLELVTGCLYINGPRERLQRLTLWRQR